MPDYDPTKHLGVFAPTCPNYTALAKRLAVAELAIQAVMHHEGCKFVNACDCDDPDKGFKLMRAFLSDSPQTEWVVVDTKDYAFMKVHKAAMPPNSSLVVAYDPGDGSVQIGDDLYPDMVVVRREDIETMFNNTIWFEETEGARKRLELVLNSNRPGN
jgi:hypothetical protein